MLSLRRFEALSQSYGADLVRWPSEVRGPARTMAVRSPPARTILAREAALDAALARHRQVEEALWTAGAAEGAVAQLQARVSRQTYPPSPKSWQLGREGRLRLPSQVGYATAGIAAVAAGLVVGGAYEAGPDPASLLSLLRPAPIPLLADAR